MSRVLLAAGVDLSSGRHPLEDGKPGQGLVPAAQNSNCSFPVHSGYTREQLLQGHRCCQRDDLFNGELLWPGHGINGGGKHGIPTKNRTDLLAAF